MISNYLIIAWRNLWRNKTFSAIKIGGLALGIACGILMMLWVKDEKNIDAFHANGSQLYSIYEKQYNQGQVHAGYATQGLMAEEMKRVLPEIQYAAGLTWNELSTFEGGGKILKENGTYAGRDFFNMFSFPLLEGDTATALQSPVGIAVSKKMATDFFGSPQQAIGKTIRYQDKRDLKIEAVFGDMPAASSLQYDFILNWPLFLQTHAWAENWTNNGPSTCIMLRKGTDASAFEKKITRFLDGYNKEQTPQVYTRLGIQRYTDMYLHADFDKSGNISGGRIQYVQLFSIVAVFILLIACINFMNLETARSVKRAKEIGIRKVAGAVRFALVRQLMGEALLTVFAAVIISLVLIVVILPGFNQITGKQIQLPLKDTGFWLRLAGLLLLTGLVAGSYPALHLSSFNPVRILKGPLKFSGSALWLRKGLVTFQFILSIVLITGTIVVNRQVNFIQSTSIGYNRENLLYIPLEGSLGSQYQLFKHQALGIQGVKDITRITDAPTLITNGTTGVSWEGKDPNAKIDFTQIAVGYDFIQTMRIQVLEGRDFSPNFATDSVNYLVNETALKILGYKNPIGQPLTLWGTKGSIIGVVKDFHFNSLHQAIHPLMLRLSENMKSGSALVRVAPGQTKEALEALGKMCKELNPKFPFTYKFSDEEYAHLYKSEQVVSQLSNYFAALAIVISCLGLLGLVMFTAAQRTKEFGIRKLLGASPMLLFGLLSKEFLSLVLLAILIATPLAWYYMDNWLEDYAYKIHMSWWMFLIAGAAALFIALITISYQAIKVSVANPVKALRTE